MAIMVCVLVRIGWLEHSDDGDGCLMTHSLISFVGFVWRMVLARRRGTKNDDGLGVVVLVVVVVAWVWERSAVESRNGFHFGQLDANAHLGGCARRFASQKSNPSTLSIAGDEVFLFWSSQQSSHFSD